MNDLLEREAKSMMEQSIPNKNVDLGFGAITLTRDGNTIRVTYQNLGLSIGKFTFKGDDITWTSDKRWL